MSDITPVSRVTINLKHLAAVLPLASTADIRYYLNGVCIVAKGDQLRTVATDGNVLGAARSTRPTDDIGDGQIIIPLDAVKDIIKKAPKTLETVTLVRLPIEQGGAPDVVRWSVLYWDVVFKQVQGVFPDWGRVMPSTVSGEVGQYHPELIARFAKVAKALGSKITQVFVHHNGEAGPAAVNIIGQPDFLGVVMPIKFKPEQVPGLLASASSMRLA